MTWLFDEQVFRTASRDFTNHGHRPSYMLFTWAFGTGFLPFFTQAPIEDMAHWRIWRPATPATQHRIPNYDVMPADLNIAFGGAFNLTLPTAVSLWGAAATGSNFNYAIDYLPYDTRIPFGNDNGGSQGATPYPTGITLTGTTLTGTVTDQPGKMRFIVSGTADGDTCIPAHVDINVGPTSLTSGVSNMTVGQAFVRDLYKDFDCGNLVPPSISVSGLPTGLTFSMSPGANRGKIVGTPSGTGTIAVTGANAIGQAITPFNIICGPATPGSGTPAPLFPKYGSLAAQGIIASLDFDNPASLTFSSGTVGAGGLISAVAGVDGTTYAATQSNPSFQPTSVTYNNRYAARFTRASSQFLDWAALVTAFPNAFGTDLNSGFTLVVVGALVSTTSPFQVWIDVGHGTGPPPRSERICPPAQLSSYSPAVAPLSSLPLMAHPAW